MASSYVKNAGYWCPECRKDNKRMKISVNVRKYEGVKVDKVRMKSGLCKV